MNCDLFRTRLRAAEDPLDTDLTAHLDGCPTCRDWLDAELACPPLGLREVTPDLPSPGLREAVIGSAEPATSWWTGLFRPFVPALVLAGVAALLVLSVQTPRSSPTLVPLRGNPASSLAQIKFLDPWETAVTPEPESDTQEWSFLDTQESEISFLDDEEKDKEEPWLEESHG